MTAVLGSGWSAEEREVVDCLLRVQEARESRIRFHGERILSIVTQIHRQMNLDSSLAAVMEGGCLLHDIGEVGIPDSILLKPGGLDEMELAELRMHPLIGVQICKPLKWLEPILPLIRHHHEKLDGSGYPDGLKGDDLSMPVRILAVANVYDGLRTERPYRPAHNHSQAMEVLEAEADRGWWDAAVVRAFSYLRIDEAAFTIV